MPRLPALLFQQLHVGDGHAPIRCVAHVVNGKQRHLNGREGFLQNQQLRTLQACSLDPFSDGLVGQNWDKTSCPELVYVTNLNSSKLHPIRILDF
jgi:hypothetical protein